MRLMVDEEVLDAARKLEPVVRDHAAQAEHERRLPQPVVEALAEAGLFRMFTPKSLGGLEVDPVTCARVIEEVAGFDSAAGWALQAGNSADWWCGRLPAVGPEEIYAGGPDTIIAAAFHPPMQATPEAGGFRVTGRRPLASNIHDADWLFVTALVETEAGEAIGVFVPASAAEVIDTWDSLGMRGTDSHDVALADVFVPTARTFPLVPQFQPGPRYRGPLYRLPGIGEAAVVICPVALAIAGAALTELRLLAQGKTPFGSATVLRERAVAQAKLARAEAIWRSARLLFYDTLSLAWERTVAGEPSTLEQKADLQLAAAHALASSVKAVDITYSLAGTSAVYARSPLERHFRDIQTLRHHGFVCEARYETAGQVYLGVDPEFALVSF